ncbi:hypothetical protein QBC40DRAFT_205523 [Triangularia verruculosa]|uniref:Aminoglycoside phosphotransferase domain-containing protein n=1 Tax=Triangularia verruculosa TaxID=2587418 RepID=A0AAN6XCG6_9PEZI|nr:hypothetical protein QBC40DRAFT_205523 [Triangularia verruculosa]
MNNTVEDNFFTRNNLPEATERLCFGTAIARFPGAMLVEPSSQGYCSYTLLNTSQQLVIQFRPEKHGIDLEIADLAREIHGSWAPVTKVLGSVGLSPRLDWYSHGLISGKTLADVVAGQKKGLDGTSLVRSLAVFFSQAYRRSSTGVRKVGRVGSSLGERLVRLREGLPVRFRRFVEVVLEGLEGVMEMPWVLTHGDFNADNVIVNVEKSKGELRLMGVVDWAEAEFLPFGTGLYGLWSILRCLDGLRPSDGEEVGGRVKMREVFWSELEREVPKLKTDEDFRERVKLAELMGVLLWNGIAFDNGALDRVVEEGRDDKEIEMLDQILFGDGGGDFAGLGGKKVEKCKS